MVRRRRFIIGGLIILAALSYIIYGGMQQAIVYFVSPSELKAKEHGSANKFLRMGAKDRREYEGVPSIWLMQRHSIQRRSLNVPRNWFFCWYHLIHNPGRFYAQGGRTTK
jgi:CcmE